MEYLRDMLLTPKERKTGKLARQAEDCELAGVMMTEHSRSRDEPKCVGIGTTPFDHEQDCKACFVITELICEDNAFFCHASSTTGSIASQGTLTRPSS